MALPICKHNLPSKHCKQCLTLRMSPSHRLWTRRLYALEDSKPAAHGEMSVEIFGDNLKCRLARKLRIIEDRLEPAQLATGPAISHFARAASAPQQPASGAKWRPALLQTHAQGTSATSSSADTFSKSSVSSDVLQQRPRRVSLASSDPGASSDTYDWKREHPQRSMVVSDRRSSHTSSTSSTSFASIEPDESSADDPQHQKSSRDVRKTMRREEKLLKEQMTIDMFMEQERLKAVERTKERERQRQEERLGDAAITRMQIEQREKQLIREQKQQALKAQLRWDKALEWQAASILPPLQDLLFQDPYGVATLNRTRRVRSFRAKNVNRRTG